LKASKNKSILYRYRAEIYAKLGNPKAAIQDLGLAMEKNKSTEIIKERGYTHFVAGNYNEAITDFTTVLRNDPADFSVYLKRAEAYEKAKDISSAIKDQETYMAYFPDDENAIYQCGELYLKNDAYIG